MRITPGNVREEFGRDLFWVKIFFESDDQAKKTRVFACAPQEYLEDLFHLSGGQKLSEEQLNKWSNAVIGKWKKLGEDIFTQDTHFDVYYSTPEGEQNGLNFLLKQVP